LETGTSNSSQAIFLNACDHVYANTAWKGGGLPFKPYKWDIALARAAMNKMIIYCKDPDRAVRAFSKAVGLHKTDTQAVGTYSPADHLKSRQQCVLAVLHDLLLSLFPLVKSPEYNLTNYGRSGRENRDYRCNPCC
jgi:hypothetical protein